MKAFKLMVICNSLCIISSYAYLWVNVSVLVDSLH